MPAPALAPLPAAYLPASSTAAPGAVAPTVTSGGIAIVFGVVAVAVLVLAVAFGFGRQVLAAGEGGPKMRTIAGAIQTGATAFLRRQGRTLIVFAVVVGALLAFLPAEGPVRAGRVIFFFVGAAFSGTIGYLGMSLATRSNVRVAAAASSAGREAAARLAVRTGGVVGLTTVGLGLLGAAGVVLIYRGNAPFVLEGFGFGAALLAMFMRVGGGIFTKAADVGADLVGKLEQHIPEDDPRNAATIADNVGDNVGDCAGMAADLFESYAVTLVAALILGRAAFGDDGLVLPLMLPAIGALTAAAGVMLIRFKPGKPGLRAIYRGFGIAAGAAAVLALGAIWAFLPAGFGQLTAAAPEIAGLSGDPRLSASGAVLVGIVLASAILWLTGYFTGTESGPTRRVARTSRTGAATVVLAGIGVGLESAVYSAGLIAAALCSVFLLAGGSIPLALFYVSLAGCGLLTTVGVIVAMDTFGPVADNAQGIAEMSGEVGEEGAEILTDLDAVGNTTKAITKGIAIATAVLAATALFGSYMESVNQALAATGETIAQLSPLASSMLVYEITSPITLVGIILGGATVFLFSGLAIDAVTRAAGAIVIEVRKQFRHKPGIMDGTELPDYGRVVDICTRDSLRELIAPGLLAACAPIAVGLGLGAGALAGFLAGAIGSGLLMAVFLSNSGGSWDNAKKIVEDGAHGGKHSEAHEATIVGDTVGDPFKDTAGPSINPLIKVMNLVGLLIAPVAVQIGVGEHANQVLRIAVATAAGIVALGAVIISRMYASRLELKAHAADLADTAAGQAPTPKQRA